MNFIIAFVYFLCALIFLLLIGVLVYFGTADSPVWKIWYKRVSRLLTVLAVFYVVLAVVGLFAEVGIWSFIIPIPSCHGSLFATCAFRLPTVMHCGSGSGNLLSAGLSDSQTVPSAVCLLR